MDVVLGYDMEIIVQKMFAIYFVKPFLMNMFDFCVDLNGSNGRFGVVDYYTLV